MLYNDRVNQFLQYVRDEVDLDPALCPCDPASCGKVLAWLSAMAAAFTAENTRTLHEQAAASEILRQQISDGVMAHIRGNAPPQRGRPSRNSAATTTPAAEPSADEGDAA